MPPFTNASHDEGRRVYDDGIIDRCTSNVPCGSFGIDASEIVITSEARNLLLFAPGKQQIPHGLKAVRDDNSEIAKTGHNLCSTQ